MAIVSWKYSGQMYLVYSYIDDRFFFRVVMRRYTMIDSKPEEEWRHNCLLEPRFRKPEEAIDWALKQLTNNGCPDAEYKIFYRTICKQFEM